jgi:hypothetical protein
MMTPLEADVDGVDVTASLGARPAAAAQPEDALLAAMFEEDVS